MLALSITAFTATSALGHGLSSHRQALRVGRSGLQPQNFETADVNTWTGSVEGLDKVKLPDLWQTEWDCRNHRLAWLGLQADGFLERLNRAVQRYGARRVAVILGTSTSGILSTEQAYRQRDPETGRLPPAFNYRGTHNNASLASFVALVTGIEGPTFVVSTACSSSAKAFASAQRLIAGGWVDAALVGGVDSLCLTTLYGFRSLELLSPQPCRPCDLSRQGISIGEAAAFVLLEKPGEEEHELMFIGWGESSVAFHMSSPHPDGRGAKEAMESALWRAGCKLQEIDYINLHGTATRANDLAESKALAALRNQQDCKNTIPCSSTKGMTGHTLGAAGSLEAVLCCLALQEQCLPASVKTQTVDPQMDLPIVLEPQAHRMKRVLSNSFGFGGSNACLVFLRNSVEDDKTRSAERRATYSTKVAKPGAETLQVDILGVGAVGPGVSDIVSLMKVLEGSMMYTPAPTALESPEMLPSAERRRAGMVVKTALMSGLQAVRHAGLNAATLPAVFASSGGDGHNCHALCEILASPERLVSPTRFHNSVHNAASGYWSIATAATQPAQVLSAWDGSVVLGLLEGIALVQSLQRPVLVIACDGTYPEPLFSKRPIADASGMAFVLAPKGAEKALSTLRIDPARAWLTRSSAPDEHAFRIRQLCSRAPGGLLALLSVLPAWNAMALMAAMVASARQGFHAQEIILPATDFLGIGLSVTASTQASVWWETEA